MIYVFVPYYNEDTPEFKKSLESQTVPYTLIKRNRKASKTLWTKAVNDFWRECCRLNTKDDDVVCIMNNDIEFRDILFEEGNNVKSGEVFIPMGIIADWGVKGFYNFRNIQPDSFDGHCFFLEMGDFKRSGGFCKLLPHALADIDFGLKIMGNHRAYYTSKIIHKEHAYGKCSNWSLRSYNNPILWTIFLLRHPNRYTFINILKAWYDGIFR